MASLLPDWYDDWVLIERERFHEVRLRALETLCESHLTFSDVTSAIRCASAAVRATRCVRPAGACSFARFSWKVIAPKHLPTDIPLDRLPGLVKLATHVNPRSTLRL